MNLNNARFKTAWLFFRSASCLFSLLFIKAFSSHAQNNQSSTLNLGDAAPPLRVSEWIKGTPVQQFKKGHVYVLEFWATWCKPCIAAMPHLSTLAREYKDEVTFIGMDIYEDELKPTKSIKQIKAFVDSLGNKIDYAVATEDTNFTVADWLEASDEKRKGIPSTFVIDGEGRLAWIGYPTELDTVLSKIVANTWDLKKALGERNEFRHLEQVEESVREELNSYVGNPYQN